MEIRSPPPPAVCGYVPGESITLSLPTTDAEQKSQSRTFFSLVGCSLYGTHARDPGDEIINQSFTVSFPFFRRGRIRGGSRHGFGVKGRLGTQWSFRKPGTTGTLASQAEIGVWVQAGARGILYPEKNSRLYVQNPAN